MFRTTHIRTKLALALAVPMVALVVIAGLEVIDAKAEVDAARNQASLAEAAIGPGSLGVHLQNERNRAAIDLIGLGAAANLAVKDNPEARAQTDPAAEDLRGRTGDTSTAIGEAFAPAWEAYAGLEDLRAEIDAYDGPMDATNQEFAEDVFSRYSAMIEALFDGTSRVVLGVDEASLRSGAEIVDASSRQNDVRARIVRTVVLGTILDTLDSPEINQEIASLYDRSRSYDRTIQLNSTGPYEGVADDTYAEPGLQSFNRQVESYLAGEGVDIAPLLEAVASDPTIGYAGLRDKAASLLSQEADRIESDAVARERLFGGIALTGLLLTLLVSWLASRSITRPLHSLRDQAEEMAGTRLPSAVRQVLDTPPGDDVVMPEVQPITVKTHDEVAEVARALNDVQSSAVDLAVEQAVLRRNISDSYINLGRRNQNLLSRQLDFITELERNETDPDTLEGLFRLDHLATRMRRNAESLLVLAGIDPPRQWSAPVKVSDVVRAALGEVEDYQRVIVRHLEPASVTGAIAADVAHVLAELIENALSFSPPDQSVEVKGRLTVTGYTVAIADNGLGMGADEVVRANRRLAGQESFTVAPSRYLGHYVAGHLASRLGILVELQDSAAGGITARVDVPMGLLADDELDPGLVPPPATALPGPAPSLSGPMVQDLTGATTSSGLPRRGDSPSGTETSEPAASALPVRPTAPAAPEPDLRDADPVPDPVQSSEPPAVEAPTAPAAPIALSAWSTAPPPVAEPEPVAEVEPATEPEPAPAPLAEAQSPSPEAVSPAPAAEAPAPPGDQSPLTARTPSPAALPPTGNGLGGRSFGGLAVTRPAGPSLYTVAAQRGRLDGSLDAPPSGAEAPAAPSSTASGLARRVPGAQRPDAGLAARTTEPASEPVRSTPEDVYSFLSNFQSGVARGRADAAGDTPHESQEDGR